MNSYNVTVVTNVGTYSYQNVIANSEKEARNIAESDIRWATKEEVLESSANFKKVDKIENDDV